MTILSLNPTDVQKKALPENERKLLVAKMTDTFLANTPIEADLKQACTLIVDNFPAELVDTEKGKKLKADLFSQMLGNSRDIILQSIEEAFTDDQLPTAAAFFENTWAFDSMISFLDKAQNSMDRSMDENLTSIIEDRLKAHGIDPEKLQAKMKETATATTDATPHAGGCCGGSCRK